MIENTQSNLAEIVALLNLFPTQHFYEISASKDMEVCYTMLTLIKYTRKDGSSYTKLMQAACKSFYEAMNLKVGSKVKVQ